MPSRMLQTPLAIALLLGAALSVVLAGLRYAADLLAPIFLAYTVAVVLLPVVERLEHRGFSRPLALFSVFLSAFVVAALLIGFFVIELQLLARRIPLYQQMLESRFAQIEALLAGWGYPLGDLLEESRMAPGSLARTALGVISGVLDKVASLLLFLFLLLTMTLDFPGVSRAYFRHKVETSERPMATRNLVSEIQTHYRLQTLSNLISATAVTVAYLAFRIDFALLWGLLTFFLSYIPRFGMLLSFIPPVLMAFVQYGLERAALLLLASIILNALMDNLVTPALTKKGLALRASTVLVSSLVWMWVFGPLGALLAMPLTLLVRNLLHDHDLTRPLAYAISSDDYAPLPLPAEPPSQSP